MKLVLEKGIQAHKALSGSQGYDKIISVVVTGTIVVCLVVGVSPLFG